MIKKFEQCTGCTACAASCPKGCISMVRDKLGFLYPYIEPEACVRCGICESVCPELHGNRKENEILLSCAAILNDEPVRKKSSSGGIFYLISKWIISQGGVVFGATFNETFHYVEHVAVEVTEDISKLLGSKYVQSSIGESYTQVKKFLEQGRLVLFSGTPCQISGLKSFLKKEYENLYLQDIACHGVPSPYVWDEYLSYIEKSFGRKAVDVKFRDKQKGWKKYLLRIEFDNGDVYSNNRSEDLYMRGFLHDYYLRNSCYSCNHKGTERESDITLADYWGIENVCPELDDDKGTSLVFISSTKGKFLFDNIAEELKYMETDLESAVRYNSSIVQATATSKKRKDFEREFKKSSTHVLLKKYCSNSIISKIKKKIRNILKK